MLLFPHAKINLGLHIIERLANGYHKLETALIPIAICDALEIVASSSLKLTVLETGWSEPLSENSCVKAWQALHDCYQIDPVSITLLKRIPTGAGLGGGSSDGAFTLRILNEFFDLQLPFKDLSAIAFELGTDTPFFLQDYAAFAAGLGEQITDLPGLSDVLRGQHILLLIPPFSISTKTAYQTCKPSIPATSLKALLNGSNLNFKECLFNDFEKSVLEIYPVLAAAKKKLYDLGAGYASLSGSGSVLYGIFEQLPDFSELAAFGKVIATRALLP